MSKSKFGGSDAEIAKDLKRRTYQLMEEGKSDNEIRDYMIERYGDFITYKPPVRVLFVVVWPFCFVAGCCYRLSVDTPSSSGSCSFVNR